MSDQNISMDDFFAAAQDSTLDSEPKIKVCKVCEKDLGFLEIQARLSYHFDCCICEHCGHEITKEIMVRWVQDKGPRAHSTCHDTYMQAEMQKRPVEITQGLLDYLNNWRLTPNLAQSIDHNQSRAEHQTRKNVIDMNHEEKYVFLKMMQAVTATISSIIANDKQSSEVKLRRDEWEKEREKRTKDLVADAENVRESQQAQVEKKKNKKLLTKQTPEGKLLNQFLAMGMTLEQAKQMLGSAHKEAEKNIQ
jgi:hypothetical protein